MMITVIVQMVVMNQAQEHVQIQGEHIKPEIS